MTHGTILNRWLTGHVVLGALLGVVVLHPATSVAYWWFDARDGSLRQLVAQRLVEAFTPGMLPMTGLFAGLGAGIGLMFGISYRGKPTARTRADFPERELARPLVTLLAAGENEQIEFKATARWDVKQGRMNIDLADAVARAIAGFLNDRGGTLLVGVSDSREIVGLAPDYATLKRQDRDGFEQFVVSLVTSKLGGDICPLIHVGFEAIDGRDVCRIVVEPAPRPIYFEAAEGARFFLRAGNTTRALDVREAMRHIADHWPKKDRTR